MLRKYQEKIQFWVMLGHDRERILANLQNLADYDSLSDDTKKILIGWTIGYCDGSRDCRYDTASKIGSLVGDCNRYRAEIKRLELALTRQTVDMLE